MLPRLIDFCSGVSPAGYEWSDVFDAEMHEGRYLLEKSVLDEGIIYAPKYINHMDLYPRLYRKFAELKPTEQQFREFANKYGRLGFPVEEMVLVEVEDCQLVPTAGESLAGWTEEHRAIANTFSLWMSVRKRNVESIWKLLGKKFKPTVVRLDTVFGDGYADLTAAEASNEERAKLIKQGILEPKMRDKIVTRDVIIAGRCLLSALVNSELGRLVAPKVLWDKKRNRQRIHIVPVSLLGALWLQLAISITRRGKDPVCQSCGEFFIAVRSDAKYCSTACRMKASRQRSKSSGDIAQDSF